jgi:hypothetical protein
MVVSLVEYEFCKDAGFLIRSTEHLLLLIAFMGSVSTF